MRKAVETKFKRFGADMNPAVWKNRVVEAKEALETYPAEPRPVTVDVKLDCKPIPVTVERTVDASSVGSIKVLIKLARPKEVERSWEEEI